MAGISVSGLISNSFDWKSVVDQLIQIDSAPIARMQTEEATNLDRVAILSSLQTKMTDLQTSIKALGSGTLFSGRTAASSTAGSSWSATASGSTPIGTYMVAVSQLATAARRVGANAISSPISATDDVSALTLANLTTATAVSAGKFTVNGQAVQVATTDTLQDIFTRISDATGGNVTATYSAATDKITLTAADHQAIVLGAANDSSNFLSVMRLTANGTDDTITSSSTLGSAALNAKLASSRLKGGFSGLVDGAGKFAVNGVEIDYNVNTDTLGSLLSRITNSGAGVSASYDGVLDRVILTNNKTGNLGIGAADVNGNLLSALGVTTGAPPLEAGKNALFTVNGGDTRSSSTNTLTPEALGVDGLTLSVNTQGTQAITVAADTEAMKTAIQDFITKFNAVESYVDQQTKITKTPDGKVTAALLSNNSEIQTIAANLRSMVFNQVTGLTGSVKRLESLGIDFNSKEDTLVIKDSAKLATALASNTADVAAFFGDTTTGLAGRLNTYLTLQVDTKKSPIAAQVATLNKQNTSLDKQIAALNLRLTREREQLTNAFMAMQTAQSKAQTQQATLTNFVKSMSSSSN